MEFRLTKNCNIGIVKAFTYELLAPRKASKASSTPLTILLPKIKFYGENLTKSSPSSTRAPRDKYVSAGSPAQVFGPPPPHTHRRILVLFSVHVQCFNCNAQRIRVLLCEGGLHGWEGNEVEPAICFTTGTHFIRKL
jgi:hypothetical protein